MMKRILFCTGEGIGNIAQTVPVIRTLKESLGYAVDFWYVFGAYPVPKFIPYVDRWISQTDIKTVDCSRYVGKVSTIWARNFLGMRPINKLRIMNKIRDFEPSKRSEVDTYMDIARDLGAKEDQLIWHGDCMYNNSVKDKYDVVIHNGYNRKGDSSWSIKSYPYYSELAKLLGDFNVCSIGSHEEFVPGTDNLTGLGFLDSLGVIKNAKLFIGNDSGLYHCANALGINNISIFTFTTTVKNYDKRFHKYTTIMKNNELGCNPCQNTGKWKKCTTQECKEIDPVKIADTARRILGVEGKKIRKEYINRFVDTITLKGIKEDDSEGVPWFRRLGRLFHNKS